MVGKMLASNLLVLLLSVDEGMLLAQADERLPRTIAVSYTHLTLPTILRV